MVVGTREKGTGIPPQGKNKGPVPLKLYQYKVLTEFSAPLGEGLDKLFPKV